MPRPISATPNRLPLTISIIRPSPPASLSLCSAARRDRSA
jgi:hypothetical protein